MARIERHSTKHDLKNGRKEYVHYRLVESRRVQGCKYPKKVILESLGNAEQALLWLEQCDRDDAGELRQQLAG
jgi:hypothetical protein